MQGLPVSGQAAYVGYTGHDSCLKIENGRGKKERAEAHANKLLFPYPAHLSE